METMIYILHLEDDLADAELIRAKLEETDLPFRITLAQTRDEYDHALQQTKYDIILSDFKLPMYDGMSALRLATELRPDVPFVFVSGTMGEEQVNIKDNFPNLIEALRHPNRGPDGSGRPCNDHDRSGCDIPDLHIGVISTDLGAGNFGLPSCEVGDDGQLQNKPRKVGCYPPSQPWISYDKGVTNVTADLLNTPANVTVIDDHVTLGDVPAGGTVTTGDTFTIRVDRAVTIDPLEISWQLQGSRWGLAPRSGVLPGSATQPGIDPGSLYEQRRPLTPLESGRP